MAQRNSDDANETVSLSERLNKMIASNSLDFNSWRALILEIEATSPDDMDTISLAYDSFLSKFPLCHWFFEKYANHKAKLCGAQEAIKIFERGAGAAMFSVGFWVDYFTLGTTCFGDPEDVRRLFGRALSCVGKDYFCHVLWDKYMKYEFDQEGWNFLAQSYVQALKFPTKKLHFYYDKLRMLRFASRTHGLLNKIEHQSQLPGSRLHDKQYIRVPLLRHGFKQFVANLEEEMGYEKSGSDEVEQVFVPFAATKKSRDDISLLVKDLLDSSDRSIKSKALDRYRSIGEELYQEACQLDEKIKCFETNIRRRYFHTNPLDDDQLNNWHLYLDFIEKQDNLDSAVKLYERCLIPCANYSEFWMRYVDFLESKRGRELCLSALDRATQIFLKNVPEIHLFNARFKEHIGDVDGARAALLLCDTKSDSSFIENVVTQANMERRLGNLSAASAMYEKALKTATEKRKLHIIPSLYSHFARLTYMITGSADTARDVLIDGIRQAPGCRLLLEELIKFAMTHEGASHVNIVDAVVADAISPGLDGYERLIAKDRESVSCLFLEFVNLCGTVHDFRKAWNRHIKLFPWFLRFIPAYKYSTSSKYWLDAVRDQQGSYNFPVCDQAHKDNCSGHSNQLRVFDVQVNHAILPSQVLGKQSPQKCHNNNAMGTLKTLSTEVVVLCNEDASHGNEPAHTFSPQPSEDKWEVMNVSAELGNNSKENPISLHQSAHDLSSQSRDDKLGPVDAHAELANKCALIPRESAHKIGKTSRMTEPVEASHLSRNSLGQEMDHDLNYQKQPVSLDNISLNSQGKESQGLNPMSCEAYETKINVSASGEGTNSNSGSFAGSKSFQNFELPPLHNKLERDGSVKHQNNTQREMHADLEERPKAGEDPNHIDHMVTAPEHTSSGFHGHAQDQEHLLQQSLLQPHQSADDLDSNMLMNQGNAQNKIARQTRRPEQLGTVQEDAADNNAQRLSMTPPSTTSAGQSPLSSPLVSFPLQIVQQNASVTNQHPGKTQQSQSMNQMLQYHYYQQHFLQQQYQQQQQSYLQMQHQYTSQQPQQNQQHVQLVNQQNYVQQQQNQSLPYKLQQQIPNFQQSSQQFQQPNQQVVGHLQSQQGYQSQELAYHMHQLGYQQHAAEGQQYQQYQEGYQHLQHQQQSQEGYLHTQEQHLHQHSTQKQQDARLQKQSWIQNQQDPSTAPPDYDGSAKPSESPLPQGKRQQIFP